MLSIKTLNGSQHNHRLAAGPTKQHISMNSAILFHCYTMAIRGLSFLSGFCTIQPNSGQLLP